MATVKWFAGGTLLAVLGLLVWSMLDHWKEERNARFSTPPDWAKG